MLFGSNESTMHTLREQITEHIRACHTNEPTAFMPSLCTECAGLVEDLTALFRKEAEAMLDRIQSAGINNKPGNEARADMLQVIKAERERLT